MVDRKSELAQCFPKWAESVTEILEAVSDLAHLQPAAPKQRLPFHDAAPSWMRESILKAADRGCTSQQISEVFRARGLTISDQLIARSLKIWRGEALEPIDPKELDSEDRRELAKLGSNGHKPQRAANGKFARKS